MPWLGHSIHLSEKDAQCHRFLWRDLHTLREPPDAFVIQNANMGDRLATAIAIEVLKATADLNRKAYPEGSEMIYHCSYIDDLIYSVPTPSYANQLAGEVNKLLSKGDFEIKCWQFSSIDSAFNPSGQSSSVSLLKGTSREETAVLGVDWQPVKDLLIFHNALNFSPKSKGVHVEPDLRKDDVPASLPQT